MDHEESYIPQRAPFVMIGDLVAVDDTLTITSLVIPDDNLFVVDGLFTEPGLIENMAQTAGAGTGYKLKKAGKPLTLGFIAGLKNVSITELPKAGDTIITEIAFMQTLLNFHLVKGKVICNGKEIASCEFKIFVHPDQDAKE